MAFPRKALGLLWILLRAREFAAVDMLLITVHIMLRRLNVVVSYRAEWMSPESSVPNLTLLQYLVQLVELVIDTSLISGLTYAMCADSWFAGVVSAYHRLLLVVQMA